MMYNRHLEMTIPYRVHDSAPGNFEFSSSYKQFPHEIKKKT